MKVIHILEGTLDYPIFPYESTVILATTDTSNWPAPTNTYKIKPMSNSLTLVSLEKDQRESLRIETTFEINRLNLLLSRSPKWEHKKIRRQIKHLMKVIR